MQDILFLYLGYFQYKGLGFLSFLIYYIEIYYCILDRRYCKVGGFKLILMQEVFIY